MGSRQSDYYQRNKEKILTKLRARQNTDGKDRFAHDENGQLWCYTKRGRVRAATLICELCKKDFPSRHNQRFCSPLCRSASQKDVARTDKRATCAFCGKEFFQRIRSSKRKCCSIRCARDLGNTKRGRKGPSNSNWKGGIRSHSAGYIRQWVDGRGYLLQHRVVMETVLSRKLEPYEEVHHKNGIRSDNRPENLELWAKRQPGGQRVKDLLEFAYWVIRQYEPIADRV